MTDSSNQGAGVCKHCHGTWESMETVAGEPAGWANTRQDECNGPKCIAQRKAASRIAVRKLGRDRRDAVRPIRRQVNASRKAKRERAAAKKGRQ